MLRILTAAFLVVFTWCGGILYSQEDDMEAGVDAGVKWVKLVDDVQYEASWENGSTLMKLKMPKENWVAGLQQLRRPLGTMTERKLADVRSAKDPKGLPAGDYMVLVYQTDFSDGKGRGELLTLVHENGKDWKVFTYQVLPSAKP